MREFNDAVVLHLDSAKFLRCVGIVSSGGVGVHIAVGMLPIEFRDADLSQRLRLVLKPLGVEGDDDGFAEDGGGVGESVVEEVAEDVCLGEVCQPTGEVLKLEDVGRLQGLWHTVAHAGDGVQMGGLVLVVGRWKSIRGGSPCCVEGRL